LGGLFNVQTDTIINLNASNSDLLSNLLSCVAFDSDGNLWVGYNFNGASRYNGSSFEHFDGGDGFTSLGVASIFVASNNAVWFGTEEGVFVYSGGSWLNYNTSNSDLVSNVILSITQDHSGDIWLATPSGICRFDGSSASGWTHYTTENSMLPDNLVRVVAPDATGNMWIGTDNGLAAFYD
jgi:ligand-binding sensor domain-containing protein